GSSACALSRDRRRRSRPASRSERTSRVISTVVPREGVHQRDAEREIGDDQRVPAANVHERGKNDMRRSGKSVGMENERKTIEVMRARGYAGSGWWDR